MKILSGLTAALILFLQLSENQVAATEDVETVIRELTNNIRLIRQSIYELKDKVAALQVENADKVSSTNVSITTTMHLVTEIRPDKLADVEIFVDEAIGTVLAVNATIDSKLQSIWTNIWIVEIEVSSIEGNYEASTDHEEDLYTHFMSLIRRLHATIDTFKAVEEKYSTTQEELESLVDAFKYEIENVITSIYDAAGIVTADLLAYLESRITHLYNASYDEFYTHESALTYTYYRIRKYALYRFNAYNGVEASLQRVNRTLNEGFKVILVTRPGVDSSVLNSTLGEFTSRINATREHFNAYLDGLLVRAFNIHTVLRYEVSDELRRLNPTVYNITCNNSVTFMEINACLVKVENGYLNLSYNVVWLVNELEDLMYNTVDKGRAVYQTECSKLITYRNSLLEAQFTSHNITVKDINGYAEKRITLAYNDGYNQYTEGYYPSVESEAKILLGRNDLLNLMSSGVTTALQNLQNATTQALKESLKTVIDKIGHVYKTNYDSIIKQLIQLSKYFYVDTLQWYKSTALNYKCSTPAGIIGVQMLMQTLEECALTKIDILVGNKTNLDRGLASLVNSTLAHYRDYDVYLNVRIHVHPAISYSLTLAPVNSSVYSGLKCFYDTDYNAYSMYGVDVAPGTYKKCHDIIIAP